MAWALHENPPKRRAEMPMDPMVQNRVLGVQNDVLDKPIGPKRGRRARIAKTGCFGYDLREKAI